MRQNGVMMRMAGHQDTVTGLRLSPDGSFVLSNSMDNTVRIWDIRAFAPQDRCLKVFLGVQHNFEKNLLKCSWSPDGRYISAGSADRFVYVWDTVTQKILYKLPGHNSSVNDVDFHPVEPILMSCGSDKKIFLGELFAS
jgi:Prp8 binding protein